MRAPRAPQKPTRRALTSRRSERRAAEMGGLGRGRRIPSALVSWRRREQSPARGRSQRRGERRSPAAPRWLSQPRPGRFGSPLLRAPRPSRRPPWRQDPAPPWEMFPVGVPSRTPAPPRGGQTRGGDPSWGRGDPRKGVPVSATLLPARDGEMRREEEGTSITPGGFAARAALGSWCPPVCTPPGYIQSPPTRPKGTLGGERTRVSVAERGASSITQVGI